MTSFDSIQALRTWLINSGIDPTVWGRGRTKTLANLWRELQEGEIILRERPPLRIVHVVQVIISQGDLILVEAEQAFGDGQRRYRNLPPSEKIKVGETYVEAAYRCLSEELDIAPANITIYRETHEELQTHASSSSYPGLPSQYHFHTVEAAVSGLPGGDFWRENKAFGEGDPVEKHRWAWRKRSRVTYPPGSSSNE